MIDDDIVVHVKKLIGWEEVLNNARLTVGKKDLDQDPSPKFKKDIMVSEHSPIRMLMFEIIWENIPYFVAMHLRTHHAGFKSGDDDLYFIKTQRTDRTQTDRNHLPQNAPVNVRVILNAQTLINVSRVRLCRLVSKETLTAWSRLIDAISLDEPELANLCVPNCLYRGFCPENDKSCGFSKTSQYKEDFEAYRKLCLKSEWEHGATQDADECLKDFDSRFPQYKRTDR